MTESGQVYDRVVSLFRAYETQWCSTAASAFSLRLSSVLPLISADDTFYPSFRLALIQCKTISAIAAVKRSAAVRHHVHSCMF